MTDSRPGATAAVLPLRHRRAITRCGPVKSCPTCRTVLDGGPILFHCRCCEKSVRAADVPADFPATAGRVAA